MLEFAFFVFVLGALLAIPFAFINIVVDIYNSVKGN